jgi:hypothetical protein
MGIVLLQKQVERDILFVILLATRWLPEFHQLTDVAQCWICFVALAGGVGHRASWLACVW